MRHQIREKTHIKIILITSSYICIQVFCLSCSLSVCLSLLAVFPPNFLNFIYNVHKYMRITPCKGIQDSLGFWIPGIEFRILCQWNLDSGFLELYSGFESPGLRIPQAKTRWITDSTTNIFHGQLINVDFSEIWKMENELFCCTSSHRAHF